MGMKGEKGTVEPDYSNPAFLKRSREKLEKAKTDVGKKIASFFPICGPKGRPQTNPDWGAEATAQFNAAVIVQALCVNLAAILEALARIENNTYGICANPLCKQQIPLDRLEACPQAIYCISCQHNLEQRLGLGTGHWVLDTVLCPKAKT